MANTPEQELRDLRSELLDISIRITTHIMTIHPTILKCPVCEPWHQNETQIKNRIASLNELLSKK